jgi:hypothetical protein
VPLNRRDMLKTLRGELASPSGDRVYLYRRRNTEDIPADAKGITYANQLADHAFIHQGKWKLYGSGDETYPSAEAILDDGWLVE